MHQVELPPVLRRLLVVCHLPAAVVYGQVVAVEVHGDLLPDQLLGHGVADAAYGHGGVLVGVVLPLLEGSDFLPDGHERLHVLLRAADDVLRGGTERCTVHVRTGVYEVVFGICQGVEAVLTAEGLAADDLDAALHVPLLVA